MLRTLGYAVLGLVICAVPITAKEVKEAPKDAAKGVTGKVKMVDTVKNTVTITTADGKDRTFMVMKDTRILGPKGGVSKERLKDDRLAKGALVTIVPGADGKMAQEVRLPVRNRAAAVKDKK